jgi:hypothetical protein
MDCFAALAMTGESGWSEAKSGIFVGRVAIPGLRYALAQGPEFISARPFRGDAKASNPESRDSGFALPRAPE